MCIRDRYKLVFAAMVLVGAVMKLDLAWALSDTFNGLMTVSYTHLLLTDFAAQDYTLLGTVLEFLANNSALPHAEALPGAWDAKAGTYMAVSYTHLDVYKRQSGSLTA